MYNRSSKQFLRGRLMYSADHGPTLHSLCHNKIHILINSHLKWKSHEIFNVYIYVLLPVWRGPSSSPWPRPPWKSPVRSSVRRRTAAAGLSTPSRKDDILFRSPKMEIERKKTPKNLWTAKILTYHQQHNSIDYKKRWHLKISSSSQVERTADLITRTDDI